MQRKIGLLLLIVLMAFSMLACGGKDGDAASDKLVEEKVTRIVAAIPDDPGSLTFLSAMGTESYYTIIGQMYDCLFEYGVGNEIVPQLAESWEKVDDLHYIFHLREGVKYSDGSDFTAPDVVFSMHAFAGDPAGSQNVAGIDLENIKIIDDYTIEIPLKSAYLVNFINLGGVRIVNEEVFNNSPDQLKTTTCGTGAYMLSSYKPGNSIVMVKNPYYWGEEPDIDEVELRVITDSSQRTNALMAGDVDIIQNPSINDLTYFKDDSNFEVNSLVTWKSNGFFMNTTSNSPCGDVHLRRAIAYAIDKEGLLKTVYHGFGSVSVAPFTESFIDYEEKYLPNGYYEYNVEKAKEELAKANIPAGTKLKIILSNSATSQAEAQIVQSLLSIVGLDSEIVTYDAAVYFGTMRDPASGWDIALNYTTCPSGLGADLINAWILHLGISGYRDPVLVDAIDSVLQKGDLTEMAPYTEIVYKKVTEDLPFYAYIQAAINIAYSSKVKNFDWWGRGSLKFQLYSLD